jgi:GMP reductase
MEQVFDFNNITLLPNLCYVESRSKCDTTLSFGKFKFNLPIVPANMESIISPDLAYSLAKEGYFYILHRFNVDVIDFIQMMNQDNLVTSISVGVNEDSYVLLSDIIALNLKVDFITIDIAHGHSLKLKKMVNFIKMHLPDVFVIGGNVCTPKAVKDLEEWGCDAVKCGIAGGSVCTTDHMTGFGNRGWQASMIEQCAKEATKPIIADGGIKLNSDIIKSLVLGATMVMVGGMLSGYKESPGDIVMDGTIKYKEFWGSASSRQTGKKNRIEGTKKLVPYNGESIFTKLTEIKESIQSGISYAGGNPNTLDAFISVDYVISK